MPRGGGKGGTLLRTLVFKLRHKLEALFFNGKSLELDKLGGFAKGMLTATIGPPAETGRCTKRKVWQTAFLLRVSSATPGATAADCAYIAACAACTKAYLRAF